MPRDLVPLTEREMADLIRLSDGRLLSCAFGTGGVALKASQSPWALPLLREWRGLTFQDGAGI